MQAGAGVGRNRAPPMLFHLGLHAGRTAETLKERKRGGGEQIGVGHFN